MEPRIPIPQDKIAAFCEKWKITEFSLFGSVLTQEFRPDSDVDVLVGFQADTHWTLFDLVRMEEDLKRIFGRDVDLVLRKSVERSENWIRRRAILSSARPVYVAR